MALLNRFFPTKKKNHKQGYVPFGKSDHTGWKPFNFTRERVRLLLFRECDARGRKLLFDSSAVVETVIENQQCSKLKLGSKSKSENPKKTETYVEVTSGIGYQYTRPSSDVSLLGEMIFGSVAMTFKGMTCKIHSMKSPDRVMCSRVFHAPSTQCNNKRRSDQSIDSSGSSICSISDSLFSLSGNHETKLKVNNTTGPLDVPNSDSIGKAPTSSLEGDSGFCGDASLHSLSSVGSSFWMQYPYCYDSQNASSSTFSYSSNSGGSLASLQRRWMKNASTSLEQGITCSPWHFIHRKNSSGLSDEISSRLHRKTQLGLTVVINVPPEQEKDMELFFFEHVAVIEGMLERLQSSVEKAYMKKDVFVHLMMDAFHDLQQWLCDLFTAPRLVCPVWIALVSPECNHQSSRIRCGIMTTFLRDFCQLIAAIDTKATNFFISTLVTAVLTHHLGWVATIMPAKAPPNSVTKPPCAVQMLHALAKSHPYNALWAQLGDLHGALGNPVKIARTIVTANGKKIDLLNKLLTSLSYFIRSGNIEKRVNSEIAIGNEEDLLNSVIEKSCISLNSSAASTSTIIPDSKSFGDRDPKANACNNSRISLNTCNEEREKDCSWNQETDLECSSRLPVTNSQSASNLKKSSTYINCLNVSSKVENNCSEKSKLYPDISNIDNEYFHPDVISEKVNRLCRIPTNALLYHLKKDESEMGSFNTCVPKKVDCEKQLSSVQTERREKYRQPLQDSTELENLSKKSDNPTPHSHKSGVIFVLGENEELVDLKNQNGLCIPKSKSDNVLCSESLNPKANVLKKSSCYPSLEGLTDCGKKSCLLEVNSLSKVNINYSDKGSVKTCNVMKANTIERSSYESTARCFAGHEEIGLDSGIVLEEETSTSKHVSGDHQMCDKINVWKNERTKESACGNNTSSVTVSLCTDDMNGNPRTVLKGGSSCCRVVTSHSLVIELEDVNGGGDIKIPDKEKKLSKGVARSQSLSFPDKMSLSCKKTVSICRRHSENMHINDRYLRDYHSVRFNFERCDGVLSDYVDGIGVDKSPQTEKKSIKISEARGNFELQDKICDKGEKGTSLNTVLSNSDVYDCACKIVSDELACEENGSQKLESEAREGNAIFDDYGALSDDELLPSIEVSVDAVESLPETKYQPALVELPLPWYSCSREQSSGLAASLLGGVSDHYMPDMVLHGCTQALPHWETALKNDLIVSAHRPMLDQEISEAVCIVGNAELWEVQLVSSHGSVLDKPGGFGIRVGMSQLVANMLESLLHLWKLRTSPEQCLQHLESKLRELCLRSQALAELLLTTELCDLTTLTSSLGLEANDVPLLLAIASTHTPQVTNLYGLSFR